MNKIINLQETRPNFWKAQYRGNYGVYTIKIETYRKDVRSFSCSCPSDYYPCKHIPIVLESINERIARNKTGSETGVFENLIRGMTLNDLQEFVIRFGLHNTIFRQAILLEFTPQQEQPGNINFSEIIRSALKDIDFDADDIYDYHYDSFEIDILDQWLAKAREYVEQGNGKEAVLIAKACLEEYAEWTRGIDANLDGYVSEDYLYEPFGILEEAYNAGYLTAEELLTYCKKEVEKYKYDRVAKNLFNGLIMNVTRDTAPETYIAMQDKRFAGLSDKSSYEAKQILELKIDFYKERGNAQTAHRIIEENLQIEDFRQIFVKEMIADNRYKEAKRLINEFLQNKENHHRFNGYNARWDEYLLEIARKEDNTKEVRKISRKFIDNDFRLEYYRVYKSTFSKEEWSVEIKKLINHYQKNREWFIASVADIYVEEKQAARLLSYLKKYLRIEVLERYHKHVSDEFPAETVDLFKQAIDNYMNNTGRDIYENTVGYFTTMLKIEGGEPVVRQMINDYRTRYKNRRSMIEIFTMFSQTRL